MKLGDKVKFQFGSALIVGVITNILSEFRICVDDENNDKYEVDIKDCIIISQ